MNDTSPEVQRMVRERIMTRSGEERFIMGAEMFEAARAIVLSSLPVGLSRNERRQRLYQRVYNEVLPAAS